MPLFNYVGIDSKGKRVAGNTDAESERAARLKLRRMGVFPTTLGIDGVTKQKVGLSMQVDFGKFLQRVKTQDIAVMTRQLATLVNANVPLVDALSALVDQTENAKFKSILSQVRERVVEGSKLSDALKAHPKVFSELYTNMVNAGESSGALDLVLGRLADFSESQAKLRGKVIGAMIYPIIMSVVGLLLMVALFVFVIPQVAAVLTDMGATLPLPTRITMAISDALSSYWYVFVLFIPIAFFAIRKLLKSEKGRAWWDRTILKLPLFGKVARLMIISRFTRTLSTLLSSGVPLLNAMDIVKNIITNVRMREVIENTRDSVREGQSVADPLKRSGEFPPLVTHMISVGEKTGELERMLERIAEAYDVQVDNTVSTLTSILEPIMILVMAGVVFFVVMSVMLPILQMNQLS